MAVHPFEYDELFSWIKDKVENILGTKVYQIKGREICKHMEEQNFVKLVKAYIYANGGKEIELNSDHSAIRIYGKRESFLNYRNQK